MKNINIIITGDELAEDLNKLFDKHKIKYLKFSKCRGFSCKFSVMEFLGAQDTKKTMLAFQASETKAKTISRFIRKYFNYKNNGIMFALNGESEVSENILYIAIVNSGKGEKVVDVIRKNAFAGATILDARGNGLNTEEFFGVEIGSAKEVVLSAIPQNFQSAVENSVKNEFKDENSDVVSFVLPISNFDKLHQDK